MWPSQRLASISLESGQGKAHRVNKGGFLNCCGKMPSLRGTGLPRSFNLLKTIMNVPFAYSQAAKAPREFRLIIPE